MHCRCIPIPLILPRSRFISITKQDFPMYKYDHPSSIGGPIVVDLHMEERSSHRTDVGSGGSLGDDNVDSNDVGGGGRDGRGSRGRIRSLQANEIQQYGLYLTQITDVWDHTSAHPEKYINTPVRVCIIDTGYDSYHEDLPKKDDGVSLTGTQTGYGDPMTDGDGHGTHVAGVIGALGDNGLGIVGGKTKREN